jgi:LacI family transcriptional regulator
LDHLPQVRLDVLRHDGTPAHVCALVDRALRSPHTPTAYLATHAEHAIAAMTHLIRQGQRVPRDVAIICRDDHAFLQWTSPGIAHYVVDPAQLARRVAAAARQLVTTGGLPARSMRLIPKFVAAGTV